MKKIFAFIKKEIVLFITLICAAATMLLVPPDAAYLGYIGFDFSADVGIGAA